MKPPCAVPVCTLILLRPTRFAALLQLRVEALHVGAQFMHVGVLAAHFANLSADRDGDALRARRGE